MKQALPEAGGLYPAQSVGSQRHAGDQQQDDAGRAQVARGDLADDADGERDREREGGAAVLHQRG